MFSKKLVCLAAFGIIVAAYGAAPAKPWQPDAHTLFLSGFENSLCEADFAAGPKCFYGIGATHAEGYFGQGIDLRGRTLQTDFNLLFSKTWPCSLTGMYSLKKELLNASSWWKTSPNPRSPTIGVCCSPIPAALSKTANSISVRICDFHGDAWNGVSRSGVETTVISGRDVINSSPASPGDGITLH